MIERKIGRPTPEELNRWNPILKAEDPTLLTPEEEGLGVQFGAEGGESIEQVPLDPQEQAIVEKLREEGKNNHFVGSPENTFILFQTVTSVLEQLSTEEVIARVAVHVSCITGHDCIIVYEPKGERFHINTGQARGYDRENFIQRIRETYKVSVKEEMDK